MNSKSLTVLVVATVAVAVVAAMTLRHRESLVRGSTESAKLFPELLASVNDVTSVTVKRKDGEYHLERTADGWTLVEKHNYPVDMEPVRKTLIGMAELTILEPKTADPARHAKLGVEEPDAEGSTSTLVALKTADGREVAKLIVGKKHEGKGGTVSQALYVRRAGEAQSWLAKGDLDLREQDVDWLHKEILKVMRDRVRAVEVTHPDGSVVHVERPSPDQKDFALANIPEGKELKFPTAATSMASALEFLNLEDVLPAGQINFDENPGAISRFTTFDGLTVVVKTKDQDGKTYARFEATYEAPPEAPAPAPADGAVPTDSAAASKPASTANPDDIKKEVADLNSRLSAWVYAIPAYNRTTFAKQLSDLVKDKAPPPPPPGEGGDAMGSEDGDAPYVIPSDIPPEIQQQIREHQESLGNKVIVEPPKKDADPAAGGDTEKQETPPPQEDATDEP